MNIILHRHNLAAYPSQALRNAVEQIYELYWESETPDLSALRNDNKVPDRGANLADNEYVLLRDSIFQRKNPKVTIIQGSYEVYPKNGLNLIMMKKAM